jgi:2-methylaconitate cis-trans-isomerase PrpF
MFPTGNWSMTWKCPASARFKATMINAGIPTIFVNAEASATPAPSCRTPSTATQGAGDVRDDPRLRRLRMGLIRHDEAATRQHTPKIAFVAPPRTRHPAARPSAGDVDLLVRALSMGKLHHAMMGTAAVAIGTAAPFPARWSTWRPAAASARRCASAPHPAARGRAGRPVRWRMDRDEGHHEPQRVLMEGWVRVPGDAF